MTIKASRLQQSLFRLFVFFPNSFVFGAQFSVDCQHSHGTVPRPASIFIRASERVPFSTSSQFESCQMYQVLTRQTEKVLFAVYALTMPDSSYVAITLIGLLFTRERCSDRFLCHSLTQCEQVFCYTGQIFLST